MDPVVFSLISTNKHYCAITKIVFGRHSETGYFFKCYFTNVNLFMFSYFESNFIENNGKSFFIFLIMVFDCAHIHAAKFYCKIQVGKVFFLNFF